MNKDTKILVTGAHGFVGLADMKELKSRGYKVTRT